ncbi:MAG: adenylate kinase [Alphaproteobacteria bacterium]|nr:adenylate kinase [Alphaproteobacteria bacterium]
MMDRVIIVGATGSGKTTFSRKLAEKTGAPAQDLDDLHWLPGWQTRETEDFLRLAGELAARERWIVAGNYSKTRDIIWPRAETVIWLDYPFSLVFWRLLRRSVLRIIDKNPICNGNTETLRQFLSKNSIMVWLFKSYGKRKREYGSMVAGGGQYPHINYIRISSPGEAEAFLDGL